MATGRMKQLIDEYEEVKARKERLKTESSKAEKDWQRVQEELAREIVDSDMKDVSDGGYVYTPQVRTRYSFRSEEALAEMGVDKIKAFEGEPFLRDLVKKSINANSMQGPLREMAESEGIPEEVMAVLSAYDAVTVGRTKQDTKSKDKVRAALERRKKDV